MRSLFRLISLVLLGAAGVGLAAAVVTNSEPESEQSPVRVVQSLIESSSHQSSARGAESPTRQPVSQPQERAMIPQDAEDQPPPAAGKIDPSRTITTQSFPSINASTVYITPPAVAGTAPLVPGAMAPYQVPYYPMVANQVGPAAAQAPGTNPFADPKPNNADAPTSPDEQVPSPEPDQQIRRDEGDDSLTINFKDSDIRDVLGMLSEQDDLNILASKGVTGKVSASLKGVDVQTALKAILKSTGFVTRHEDDLIYVGTPEDFKSMDQAQDTIGTRIYRTNYVTATELQTLIAPLLTDVVGKSTISSPAEVDIPSDDVKTGGDNFAGGEVLLVRDYEAVLQQVDQIVEEIDRQPLQVAIEAVILTVNLDDGYEMGVNFELLRDNNNIRLISGVPLSDLANIDPDSDGGLKIGFLDTSLSVLLKALETVGDTNVVASPKVMCLNKQRAEVHIGEELAYITTTVTETSAIQTVEFLSVGTQLRIRPYISSDGMIRMEIHPELSTGNVRIEGNMTLPDKQLTQVTSNVMCRDGCTVVIGGLLREDMGSTTTQIPLFGSLPFVGSAFRQRTEQMRRDEIIVLITPQIVHDPFVHAEGNEAACYARDRLEVFADKMSPIGTRFYGRQYARKAVAAWSAGDVETALRYVNLAIHFDRQNSEALRLRRQIAAACPPADNNIDMRLRQGLRPLHHPHVEYSRTGWPWRTPESLPVEEHIIEIEEVPAPEAEIIHGDSGEDDTSTVRREEKPSTEPLGLPSEKSLPLLQ